MPVAELDGLRLRYLRAGSGPPLLLVAGIPAVATDWLPLASDMSAARDVIAYDNRGSGGSSVTPGPYTTRQLAGDAVALLDHLGIARADVFGMSMGGMIAQELAIGWPDRVRRLVLGCTHAGVRHAVRPPRESGRAFALRTEDWGERMRALAPHAFASTADPALVAAFVEKKAGDPQPTAGYDAQIAAVLAHDAYDRLPDIAAPTLVLTGDDDRIIPAASSDVLAERIPAATLSVIAGTGHLFFLERPDETRAALEAFLGD